MALASLAFRFKHSGQDYLLGGAKFIIFNN